jgi:hypothetical protein
MTNTCKDIEVYIQSFTIQFPLSQPIPYDLIGEVLIFR